MKRLFLVLQLVPVLLAQVDGYPQGLSVLSGRGRLGWELQGQSLRIAIEVSEPVQWVSVGFQEQNCPIKMTGEAFLAKITDTVPHSYSLRYRQTPSLNSGTGYFTNGTWSSANGWRRLEIQRTLMGPKPASVSILCPANVRLMCAYSDQAYPTQHTDRSELTLDLRPPPPPTPPTATAAPTSPSTTVSAPTRAAPSPNGVIQSLPQWLLLIALHCFRVAL